MIKRHLLEKEFILAYSYRETKSIMVGGRQASRSRKLRDNIFDCKQEAKRVKWKCVVCKVSMSAPVADFLQKRHHVPK